MGMVGVGVREPRGRLLVDPGAWHRIFLGQPQRGRGNDEQRGFLVPL